jgi:hypothetical protein
MKNKTTIKIQLNKKLKKVEEKKHLTCDIVLLNKN